LGQSTLSKRSYQGPLIVISRPSIRYKSRDNAKLHTCLASRCYSVWSQRQWVQETFLAFRSLVAPTKRKRKSSDLTPRRHAIYEAILPRDI